MEQSKNLSLVGLLKIANEAYEDGYLAEYFDPDRAATRQRFVKRCPD
jgi:predicted RNA-binding protein with PUA-like domain